MATGQRVKVRPKTSTKVANAQATKSDVSTSQLVNQRQSQELAQTLVHGSISCIAYLRDLFPDKCFEEQVFSSSNMHVSYEDYASGKAQPQSSSRSGSKIRALQRGHNDNVDLFLDMLEKGAFEALEKKVLRAIQINISENPDNPVHIVESYTFTFSYQTSLGGTETLAGVTMQDPSGANTTVKNVKYALQMFVRKIIALCETLPELPARRYLHMQLYYTEDCERTYEPPGFVPCKDTRICFAEHDGWHKQTEDCGLLDAGYHAVSLKLSHLQQDLEVAATQSDAAPIVLPPSLQYTSTTLGENDIDTLIGSRLAKRKMVQRTVEEQKIAASERAVSTQSPYRVPKDSQQECMEVDEEHTLPAIGQMTLKNREDLSKPPTPGTVAAETQASTQTREDRITRRRLQKMMMPSPQAQNTEDTQRINSPAPNFKAMDFLSQMPPLQLSKSKEKDLESRQLPSRTRGKEKYGSDSVDIIACECGHNEEEDGMIHCHFCDRWQHLVCYGYPCEDDPRIPEVHACYKCLLQEKEGPLLTELEHLTLLRKGAGVAIKEGVHSDRHFAEALHCDTQTAAKLVKHLRKEGFLIRTSGANKIGFNKTGKPTWHIVENGPQRAKMMSMYFDPTTNIAHHFEIPRPLPDTVKTTQFPLPHSNIEMSAAEDTGSGENSQLMAVPDSMDLEYTQTAIQQQRDQSRLQSQAKALAESAQQKEPFPEIVAQVAPPSHAKRLRGPLPERDLNPSTPVRPTSKRSTSAREDEPFTPSPSRKKIKASRAPVVNVGRSPTLSVASFLVGDVEDLCEDNDI